MPGAGKATDIADLSDEDPGHDRPDAADGLDGLVAGVVFEHGPHLALDHGQFPLVELEEVPQRLDSQRVHPLEGHFVDQRLAAGTEHPAQLGEDAVLGHHRVDLPLGRGSKRGQLRSVTDQLSHLADLRWGDPTLREIVLAQPVGQSRGVAHVVLDSAAIPMQTQRMDQMHSGSLRLKQIGSPIPAIR